MRVYCLGELMLDMIGEELEESGPAVFRRFAGGAAGNVAAGLSKLGVAASFLGRVSSDAFGSYLLHTLNRYGVDTTHVVRDPNGLTTLAFVSHDQDKLPHYLFYRENSASVQFCLDDLSGVEFRPCDALYFSSLSLAHEPIRTANFAAAERANQAGAPVAFDPNVRLGVWKCAQEARAQILKMIERIDILKVNDEELQFLFGTGDRLSLCLDVLQKFPRIRLIAVTLGKEGADLVNREGEYIHAPSAAVPVVDTCGAGDTFLAALLKQYLIMGGLRGNALRMAAAYANAAAHITSLKKGVIPAMPTEKDIARFMNAHSGECI